MQITVNVGGDKTVALEVEPTDSVVTLKAMLQVSQSIPRKKQRLQFGEERLDDTKTLADYKVVEGSVMQLTTCFCGEIQIYVKMDTGKRVKLEVGPSDTISLIKAILSAREKINREDQCLLFNGVILDDEKLLSDYKIENDAVLDYKFIGSAGFCEDSHRRDNHT